MNNVWYLQRGLVSSWLLRRHLGISPDGYSQGCFVVGLALRQALDGKESPLLLLDWCSKRLNRINRSSLNSEGQALPMLVSTASSGLISFLLYRRTQISIQVMRDHETRLSLSAGGRKSSSQCSSETPCGKFRRQKKKYASHGYKRADASFWHDMEMSLQREAPR